METRSTWILVGLGNPGGEYTDTRHNVGWMLLDRLAEVFGAGREERVSRAAVRRVRRSDQDLILVRPLTYMNRSGDALVGLPESAAVGADRHMILFDDTSLPFGALRFRSGGSDGGHRGLRSIIAALGTDRVPRLRMGIGAAEPGRDLAEYVLEPFSSDEEERLGPWLNRAVEGIQVFLEEGPQTAMNRFNPAGPDDASGRPRE